MGVFCFVAISSSAKDRVYESSVPVLAPQQTKYYLRGEEVPEWRSGTVTLSIEGEERHFQLGADITYIMEQSLFEEGTRIPFTVLQPHEPFDRRCRNIEWDGKLFRSNCVIGSMYQDLL